MNQRQPKPNKRQDVATGVAMPKEMLAALDQLAEERQIYSRSPLVRVAIKEYLERQKCDQKQEVG